MLRYAILLAATIVGFSVCSISAQLAHAQFDDALTDVCHECSDGPIWRPFLDFSFQGGAQREAGEGLLFLPLTQSCDELLFADLRGKLFDDSSQEGNWGLAYRRLLPSEWIVGAYGFYDLRHAPSNNNFQQVVVGAEMLNVDWDFRLNGYIPEGGAKPVTPLNRAFISSGNIVVQQGLARAYWGLDAEVGKLLYTFGGPYDSEVRGYVGGFYFDNSAFGFEEIAGPRGRVELRLYDLPRLGVDSRLVLGGQIQHDDVRGTQATGLLTLRIPFGPGGRGSGRLSPLQRRMVARIERDIDVVSQTGQGPPEFAIDPVTGMPYGPVTIVDANTANVPDAVDLAGDGSTVVFDGSKGQIKVDGSVDGSIFTGIDQHILGGGQTITVQSAGGVQAPFTTPGSRPEVHDAGSGVNVFEIDNGVTIRGLDITGGSDGISSSSSVTGVQIVDNNISGAGDAAVEIGGSFTGTVSGNTANNNSYGFYFGDSFTGTFSNNTANSNDSEGVYVGGGIEGMFSNNTANWNDEEGFEIYGGIFGTFSNNTANQNYYDGFYIEDGIGDSVEGAIFSNNTANFNYESGFEIYGGTYGTFSNNTANANYYEGFYIEDGIAGTFSNNTANANEEEGFEIYGGIFGTFSNNTANQNYYDGFYIDDGIGDSLEGATFANNTAIGNMESGFEISGDVYGTFSSNIANDNDDGGFYFSGTVYADVIGNTAIGNIGYEGFYLTGYGGLKFNDNTANFNEYTGIEISGDIAGEFTGNTAMHNEEEGFYIDGDITGTFSNNTATMNDYTGFDFGDITASGIFSDNMADGNRDHGFSFGSVDGTFTSNTANANWTDGFTFGTNFGTFSDNVATGNDGAGYAGANSGTATNNTGSRNGSGDVFP